MLIYMSYAGEDVAYGKRFRTVCKPIAGQIGFTLWSEQDIIPGRSSQYEMANQLKQAFLFVPFVSSDWLASDRCRAELTAALQLQQMGQLRIVPVLLRPSLWRYSSLSSLPVLPSNGQEVTHWPSLDEAWIDVQSGLIEIIRGSQIG